MVGLITSITLVRLMKHLNLLADSSSIITNIITISIKSIVLIIMINIIINVTVQ